MPIDGQTGRRGCAPSALFKFNTDKPGTFVALGCGQGSPEAASLDGKLADLYSGQDGFQVRVEKPGEHQLTLDLVLGITVKGTDRGIELDLPSSAVTLVDLQLPEGVRQIRLGGKPLTPPPAFKDGRLVGAVGAVNKLDLAWKGPAPQQVAAPLLVSEGQVLVRVTEKEIATECELALKVLRGQTNQWRLQVPPQAELFVGRYVEKVLVTDERVVSIDPPDPNATVRTIRLNDPTADPVIVMIHVKQNRPATSPGTPLPVPIGPFHVIGAVNQHGTIRVTAPPGLAVHYQTRGEPLVMLNRREVAPEDRRADPLTVAKWDYRCWPAADKPVSGRPAEVMPAFLELEIETIKEVVETRVTHVLTLERARAEEPLSWWIETRIQATPVRSTTIQVLQVQLPADYEYDTARVLEPADANVEINDLLARVTQITLPEGKAPFLQLTLHGKYKPVEETGQVTLDLPVPLDTRDRGGEFQVVVKPGNVELLPPRGSDPAWEKLGRGSQKYGWTTSHMPRRVDLAWGPYQTELIVQSKVNITLSGQQGRVEHSFWLPSSSPPPRQLRLRWPDVLADRVTVTARGEFAPSEIGNPASRIVLLKEPISEKDPLVLGYFFSLPTAQTDGRSMRFLSSFGLGRPGHPQRHGCAHLEQSRERCRCSRWTRKAPGK